MRIRTMLLIVVLSAVLPLIVLVVFYGWWNVRLHEAAVQRGLQDTARALSLAVDREVNAIIGVLDTLATSPSLQAGDLRGFAEQAAAVARANGGWIVLFDESTQQLVNTRRPYGEPLPMAASQATVQGVFAGAPVVISGLFIGNVAQQPIVAVDVPVRKDGRIVYALDMSFHPERFSRLLSEQELPDGWIASLVDGDDEIIGRSPGGSAYVGRRSSLWLVDGSRDAQEGVLQGQAFDGRHVQVAFQRSPLTGWKVNVAAPSSEVRSPVVQAAGIMAAGAFASVVLALTAALLLGRRIVQPLQTLARSVESGLTGRTASLPQPNIQEIGDVQRALVGAAAAIEERWAMHVRLAKERQARIEAERAHAEISARELKLRRLYDASIAGMVTLGDGRILDANDAFLRMIGRSREDLEAGRLHWREITAPEYGAADARAEAELAASGECRPYMKELLGKDGSRIPVLIGAVKLQVADPTWIKFVIDLSERKRAEDALRASEERLRLAQAAAGIGIYDYDLVTGRIHCDARAREFWAVPEDLDFTYDVFMAGVNKEDREATQGCIDRALDPAGSGSFTAEYRVIGIGDGVERWIAAAGRVVFDAGKPVRMIGTVREITEQKHSEQRQALLMAELDHRVRNILATIQAMVSMTGVSAPSKEECVQRLRDRIAAMARTHRVLTDHNWKGGSLEALVRNELRPYVEGKAVLISRDADVVLRPKQSLDFALFLHELATNAAKYGALSKPQGRVAVGWQVVRVQEVCWLRLQWSESGGPRVQPPTRRGFGLKLIESVFAHHAGGRVDLAFEPDGLRCTLELALSTPVGQTRPRPEGSAAAPLPASAAANPAPAARTGAVLLVEDEPVVAMALRSLLTSAGLQVIGPANTLAQAMGLADDPRLAAAVLDINLRDETTVPLAESLVRRQIPVLFLTGYDTDMVLPPHLRHLPALQKPADEAKLIHRVQQMLAVALAG